MILDSGSLFLGHPIYDAIINFYFVTASAFDTSDGLKGGRSLLAHKFFCSKPPLPV